MSGVVVASISTLSPVAMSPPPFRSTCVSGVRPIVTGFGSPFASSQVVRVGVGAVPLHGDRVRGAVDGRHGSLVALEVVAVALAVVRLVVVAVGVDRVGAGPAADVVGAAPAVDRPVAVALVDVVVAGAAHLHVVALTAVHHVVAVVARHRVVARPAVEVVCAGAAVHRVVAGAAELGVVAGAALDAVPAGAPEDEVVAAVADEHVVAAQAADHVVVRRAPEDVVAGRADDRALVTVDHGRPARPGRPGRSQARGHAATRRQDQHPGTTQRFVHPKGHAYPSLCGRSVGVSRHRRGNGLVRNPTFPKFLRPPTGTPRPGSRRARRTGRCGR